jgi:Uma2 family endonuclease
MTAEEFFARYPKHFVELVRGVVREVPMPGGQHGKVTGKFVYLLSDFNEKNDLGHVVCNDTFVITARDPDTVLGVDVGFISYSRAPKGPLPDGPLPAPPELAVEVRSPSDLWTELFAKAEEYFTAGVNVVLLIDPPRRVVAVCRPGPVQQDLTAADTLTFPDILPGFSVPVARLFE